MVEPHSTKTYPLLIRLRSFRICFEIIKMEHYQKKEERKKTREENKRQPQQQQIAEPIVSSASILFTLFSFFSFLFFLWFLLGFPFCTHFSEFITVNAFWSHLSSVAHWASFTATTALFVTYPLSENNGALKKMA